MTEIAQVHTRHVERHARRAIARRVRDATDAIISVSRDSARPKNVILHVNSGGNASAATSELRDRGYRVEPTDYDPFGPGNYGVQLRVGLQEK